MIPLCLLCARRVGLLAAAAGLACLAGCDAPVRPATFEPNLVHTMKYQLQQGIPMEQASQDSTWVVETMFGTPDQPKLPAVVTEDKDLAALVSMDRLLIASGPDSAAGRGLYQKHCVICHGVTGNGRGPTAAEQVPYPRDYRMGVFKFKSTPRGAKPTREDLAKSIRGGIAGTAMKPIPGLSEDDIQALVDYVIYLSWRGEVERRQVDMAVLDGVLEEGERIIDSDFGRQILADEALKAKYESSSVQEEQERYKRFQEDWELIEEYAADVGESWLRAEEQVVEAPQPPTGFPLAESYESVATLRSGPQAEEFNASVQRGRELFVGSIAACSKCHGQTGLGDGQTADYDDWTKDWTTRVGLKPEDRDSLIPLLARGALAPRNAMPRNFAEGIFRGGSTSKDLYQRIMQGIDGTPMPAATFVEGQFEQQDVWHLINFIRSLQLGESDASVAAPASPAT
jgi:mono/diheme cytochrome c family protein